MKKYLLLFLILLFSLVKPNITIQSINLFSNATNWVSLYVSPANQDLLHIFQPLLDSAVLISITDNNGYTILESDSGWVNEIGNISMYDAYEIIVSDNYNFQIEGDLIELPMTYEYITPGIKLISYPVSTCQRIENIFEYLFNYNLIIQIKNDQNQVYSPSQDLASLEYLVPGEGYQIVITAPLTFDITYPEEECNLSIINSHQIDTFSLIEIYPNPFNSMINISFLYSRNDNLLLEIYNINGKLIDVIFNGRLSSGNYNFNWEPNNNISSGLYFIKLKNKSKIITKRISLIK